MGFLERRAITNLATQFYAPAFIHTCQRALPMVQREQAAAREAQADPAARPVLKLRDGLVYDQALRSARWNAQCVVYRHPPTPDCDAIWLATAVELLGAAAQLWGETLEILVATRDEAMHLAALEAGDDPDAIEPLLPDQTVRVKLDMSALAPSKVMSANLITSLSIRTQP